MPRTTLDFYRKKQTLAHLASERPKDLGAVREILKTECDRVEYRLAMVEEAMHGRHCTAADFIRKYVPHIKHVMLKLGITEIYVVAQIEELRYEFIRAGHSTYAQNVNIDEESLAMLEECYLKIIEAIPASFSELSATVREILKYTDRYLLSFVGGNERKRYMDTASYYQYFIEDLHRAIETNVDDIQSMADRFSGEGLDVKMFGMQVTDLARKCDAKFIPFLLMFPQACANIRNACRGVRQWLQADEMYPEEIRSSLLDLSSKTEQETKSMRERQDLCTQQQYKIKMLRKDMGVSEKDVTFVRAKEDELTRENSLLKREMTTLKLDLSMAKEASLVKRQVTLMDLRNDTTRAVKELKNRFHVTKKELKKSQAKLTLINDKKRTYEDKVNILQDLKTELRKNRALYLQKVYNLDDLNEAIDSYKNIYKLKMSPDTLKKIFFSIPIGLRPWNSHSDPQHSQDPLVDGIRIASRFINRDWMRLYQVLPFYPNLGHREREEDIVLIRNTSPRLNLGEEARMSLDRWRRANSRANISDLKGALQRVKRLDIIKKIDNQFRVPSLGNTGPTPKVARFRPHRVMLPDIVDRGQMMAQYAPHADLHG